jgi:hypothetical protein
MPVMPFPAAGRVGRSRFRPLLPAPLPIPLLVIGPGLLIMLRFADHVAFADHARLLIMPADRGW